jgi:hypothetical protein
MKIIAATGLVALLLTSTALPAAAQTAPVAAVPAPDPALAALYGF